MTPVQFISRTIVTTMLARGRPRSHLSRVISPSSRDRLRCTCIMANSSLKMWIFDSCVEHTLYCLFIIPMLRWERPWLWDSVYLDLGLKRMAYLRTGHPICLTRTGTDYSLIYRIIGDKHTNICRQNVHVVNVNMLNISKMNCNDKPNRFTLTIWQLA